MRDGFADARVHAFGSDKCLECQSGATSRPPRRENRARGGSDSSSNVFCRHARASIKVESWLAEVGSGARCHVRSSPARGSRSEYFQGNVTDAFRRSEAELACSEIGIVTTRTSRCEWRNHRSGDFCGRERAGRGGACDIIAAEDARLTLYHGAGRAARSKTRDDRGTHPRTTQRCAPQKCRRRLKSAQVLDAAHGNFASRLPAPGCRVEIWVLRSLPDVVHMTE